jgi:hypothetical protein
MVMDFTGGLKKIPNFYPDYDTDAGYELASFVWFQGWNDEISWPYVKEYKWNLANFIRDVRLEFAFIVGELGMHSVNVTGRGADRVMAMRAVERGVTMTDEFRNSTLFVTTAIYMVANGTACNGGYHYEHSTM